MMGPLYQLLKMISCRLTESTQFKPVFEKMVNVDKGVKCIFNKNHIRLRLTNLPDKPMIERSELIQQYLVWLQDAGILDTTTPVNELADYWKVQNYEWNLIIRGKLGRQVFTDLRKHAKGSKYPTSFYLTGKNAGVHIKCYNITAKNTGFRSTNRATDDYKIEWTFQNKKVIKDSAAYGTFSEITSMYHADLTKSFNRLLKVFRKHTICNVRNALDVKDNDALIQKILSDEISFTNLNG